MFAAAVAAPSQASCRLHLHSASNPSAPGATAIVPYCSDLLSFATTSAGPNPQRQRDEGNLLSDGTASLLNNQPFIQLLEIALRTCMRLIIIYPSRRCSKRS
jgi:hypothetical protein